jgi:COP9 signalosome complex subunit 5
LIKNKLNKMTSTLDSKSTPEILGGDRYYAYDAEKVKISTKGNPWMTDRKYFKRVKISPSAITKMMMHGQSGVDKGIKAGGVPVEIMGLLLGYPDVNDQQCLIISDAQALPIDGFETRVVADDEQVSKFMIAQRESNELTRKDRFCGWYHTHPFELDLSCSYSNAYLSSTDINTQLQWQNSEDRHGNPWLSIVIDPLRSIAKGRPELYAFRVYPPDYNPPANETPDGTIVTDDHLRVKQWGTCWSRYYQLEVSYFMSNLAKTTLGILQNNFSWQNMLTTTLMLEQGNIILFMNILIYFIIY